MTMSPALDSPPAASVRVKAAVAPGPTAQPLAPAMAAMAVMVLTVLSLMFARSADLVAALWASAGLAVAVWLRTSRGPLYDLAFGGLVALGLAAGNLLAGNSAAMTAVFTVANMTEIYLAVVLARRFAPTLNLASVAGACRFLVSAGAVAPLPSAVLIGGLLWWMNGADFFATAQTWWFGHALSIAVIGSFGLAVTRREIVRLRAPARAAEAVMLFAALTAVCAAVFLRPSAPVAFLILPLLLLIAVRLRVVGTTAALVLITVLAVGGSMLGNGPYSAFGGPERAMMAQLLVLLGYLPILLVAALLVEDRHAVRLRPVGEIAEVGIEVRATLRDHPHDLDHRRFQQRVEHRLAECDATDDADSHRSWNLFLISPPSGSVFSVCAIFSEAPLSP